MASDIRIEDPPTDVREDLDATKEKYRLSWVEFMAAVAVDPPADEVLRAALVADEPGDVLDEFCASEAARGENGGESGGEGDGPLGGLNEFTPGE